MNFSNKTGVIIIGAIMAVIATTLFFVVDVTALFVTAYIFTLIGIALLCLGTLYLFENMKSYPWGTALPMTCWRYLMTQLAVSAVFVIAEQVFDRTLPTAWFVIIHVAILGFYLIMLMLQKSGLNIIEKRDVEVKEKVAALKVVTADAESAMRKFPQFEKEIKAVVEALRYSDPMSHQSLAPYEEQIQRRILALNDSPDKIPELCAELLRQIADRNARVQILK